MSLILQGALLSFGIGLGGYLKQSLSKAGLIASVILGTLIYYLGGFLTWALLIGFFLTSTVASKFKARHKESLGEMHQRTGPRDWVQVLANGVVPLIYALFYHTTGFVGFLIAYATAIAAANSDTWSSELGVLSKKAPVSILNLKPVKPGESGGISLAGTIAGLCGSAIIALFFLLGFNTPGYTGTLSSIFWIVTFGGFLGSILDSLIGASLQAKFMCRVCGEVTEKLVHHGRPTKLRGGIPFVSNDVVNLVSPLLASLLVLASLS